MQTCFLFSSVNTGFIWGLAFYIMIQLISNTRLFVIWGNNWLNHTFFTGFFFMLHLLYLILVFVSLFF